MTETNDYETWQTLCKAAALTGPFSVHGFQNAECRDAEGHVAASWDGAAGRGWISSETAPINPTEEVPVLIPEETSHG